MYIHRLHPELIRFTDTLAIRWYGVSYLAGFLLGYVLLKHLIRKGLLKISVEQLQDFLTWMCMLGVMLGGRVGYYLFYTPGELIQNPLQLFMVWQGGMASHGGILGCALVLIWWARKHKVSLWNLADNFVTVVPLGLGLGRMANFINGELWGRVSSVPWAMVFPLERPEFNPGGLLEAKRYDLVTLQNWVERGWLQPRHPSQLYQAFAEGFLLFALMWGLRMSPWSQKQEGRLCAVFILGYAAARFFVEFVREPDSRLFFGWMTTGQFLTLFMVLAVPVTMQLLPRFNRESDT